MPDNTIFLPTCREEAEEEEEEESGEAASRSERDRIRQERTRERERELRLEAAGKKGKLLRDEDRDISEKIALGQAASGPRSEESMYDQRLFNQTQGMDAGFGDEDCTFSFCCRVFRPKFSTPYFLGLFPLKFSGWDQLHLNIICTKIAENNVSHGINSLTYFSIAYNIYSKPLFQSSSANVMYRPRKNEDDVGNEDENMAKLMSTNKFKPDKDFSGVDRSKPSEVCNDIFSTQAKTIDGVY